MDTVNLHAYLSEFNHAKGLQIDTLWREMDRVWLESGCKLNSSFTSDSIARFYSHPVWILNGLFSSLDLTSIRHRDYIVSMLGKRSYTYQRIADFGGGSGVLARSCAASMPSTEVELIDPYPSFYYEAENRLHSNLHVVPKLAGEYDAIICQDVLEHLEDPVSSLISISSHLRYGGMAIFANCFYPYVLCHLPRTFFLRRTFSVAALSCGLILSGIAPRGCRHILSFTKIFNPNNSHVRLVEKVLQPLGFTAVALESQLKSFFPNSVRKVNQPTLL